MDPKQPPDLEAENIRLQQLAALGELAAGVTHESRNLLTAIVGFAQLARMKKDPDATRRHLEQIEREALRCVEILERFLTFSRTNGADLELVDLANVIGQVINATEHQMGMHRITLVWRPAASLPRVQGRRGEITQVVLNLLINAMHATPEGGTVTVTAEARAGGVEIAVGDTGEGIPRELHERVFEPFFTTKAAGQGTGLGLALCRRIVTAIGGTIAVDPDHAPGARIVVRLLVAEG